MAKNYLVMCEQTKDIFHFGENVDIYENDKIVDHHGTWLAGDGNNKPGLMMAGTPKLKMRYYQEIAPGVAMPQMEIISLDETCKTPAGVFSKCLKVVESSAAEPGVKEYKYYAPTIGFVQDETLRLTKYGFIKK